MFKYSKMLRMSGLALENGNSIGHVHDIVFDLKNKYVAWICMSINARKRFLSFGDVIDINGNIVIQSDDKIKDVDRKFIEKAKLVRGSEILNKKIMTNKGYDIGYINDIYIDLNYGSIEAFEISDGIVQDIISGRSIIPLIGELYLKKDYFFISKDACEEIIESERGLHKIFS